MSNFTLLLEAVKTHTHEAEADSSQINDLEVLKRHIALANTLIQEIQETIDAFNRRQQNPLHRGWPRARVFSPHS